MKTAVKIMPVIVVALLVLLPSRPVCGSKRVGAPSIGPGMPDEVVSRRDVTLEKEDYRRLAGEWRRYGEEHPGSAIALVQLARALRYAGAPVEEVHGYIMKTHRLDPALPEALCEMAETAFIGEHALATPEEAFGYGRRAVEAAPGWPYPHFGLCVNSIHSGLPDSARHHARMLVEKGGIGEPLLDFGHNLLVSAGPGAKRKRRPRPILRPPSPSWSSAPSAAKSPAGSGRSRSSSRSPSGPATSTSAHWRSSSRGSSGE